MRVFADEATIHDTQASLAGGWVKPAPDWGFRGTNVARETKGNDVGVKDKYDVVSFSGGKDSTAMLLHMVELGIPIDEIIFCDTGVEFPQMYDHLDKVESFIGRKITRLRRPNSFEDMLLSHVKKSGVVGYSFPDFRNRWCTAYYKINHIKTYLRQIRKEKEVIEYVGIAADEPKRVKDKRYPLVEWGWTEADCLQYCYDKGFDWGGLYKTFRRVSCWCCPLKGLDELRQLRRFYPELWAQLIEWQSKTWRKFRADYSVDELEAKFAKEDEEEDLCGNGKTSPRLDRV